MPKRVFLTFIFLICFYYSAFAYDRVTPIVKAYQQTQKAVVSITGKQIVSAPSWFEMPDPFGNVFGPKTQQEVVILGSGVVAHEDGFIITNAHVVDGTEQIKAAFSDGSEFTAKIIIAASDKDIAVLKIESDKKFPFVQLGRSGDLMIGETVIAIGNPFGYANSVTTGIISATHRDLEISKGRWLRGLIQTDAPINRGNSGGPLLNINGELIGITTAIASPSGGSVGVGFAIPIDTIADSITQMLMPEKLRRVQLGLVIGRMKTENELNGLTVDYVVKNSPAEKNGLKAGDLITKIDGKTISGFLDFFVKIMHKDTGEPILIEYIRKEDNKLHTAKLEMIARPLPDGRKLISQFFQMDLSELNEAMASRFGYDKAFPVLVITDVFEGGVADKANLSGGDLILAINGISVSDLNELSLVMEKVSEGDDVEFKILRIGRKGNFQVQRQYSVVLKAGEKNKNEKSSRPKKVKI